MAKPEKATAAASKNPMATSGAQSEATAGEAQTVTSSDVGSVESALAGGTGASAAETPSGAGTDATERKRAPAANFLPIVRGRLPLIFVHAVRFNEALAKMSNNDVAKKLGTSVGKVFDIRKGRNFSYVDASFKPSADDVTAAKAWIEQVGATNAKGVGAQGDKALMEQLLTDGQKGGLATAEEVAAFSAARTATRTPGQPKAAAAGGAAAPAAKLPGQAAEKQVQTADADSLLG